MSEVVALTIVLKVAPIQLLLNYKKYADAVSAMNEIFGPTPGRFGSVPTSRLVELSDDYGHKALVVAEEVAAVLVTDILQQNEAQMEIALATARTQSRLDKIAQQERLSPSTQQSKSPPGILHG